MKLCFFVFSPSGVRVLLLKHSTPSSPMTARQRLPTPLCHQDDLTDVHCTMTYIEQCPAEVSTLPSTGGWVGLSPVLRAQCQALPNTRALSRGLNQPVYTLHIQEPSDDKFLAIFFRKAVVRPMELELEED